MKDFSKITRPSTHLLDKDVPFDFIPDYLKAFEQLKDVRTTTLIIHASD